MEMEIISGVMSSPWFITIYGRPGIGKSTMASWAPNPIFIDLAGGLNRIDCKRTRKITTKGEFEAAVKFCYTSDFNTIVIDEVGALEEILVKNILERDNKGSLADYGYGKGYELLAQEWLKTLNALDYVRQNNKNILFVAHDIVERFADPTSEDYDRYSINIHKKALTAFVGKMDAVLFARRETIVKDKESKGGKKRAIGSERRLVYTEESPAYAAKNRFGLRPEEELDRTFWNKLI